MIAVVMDSLVWPLAFVATFSQGYVYVYIALTYILAFIGIRTYIVRNKPDYNRLLIYAAKYGISTEYRDDKPYGTTIGQWFLMYPRDGSCTFNVITSERIFKRIMDGDNDACGRAYTTNDDATGSLASMSKSTIEYIQSHGAYDDIYYCTRKVDIANITPTCDQQHIIDDICALYRKRKMSRSGSVVAYIHGPPGTGKSMLGIIIAKHFGSYLCDTYSPIIPGESLTSIYTLNIVEHERPLIIVLNEFDMLIDCVHNNRVPTHMQSRSDITDKTSFNNFMDHIDSGLFRSIIVILTSNATPNDINNIDASYLRRGRVHYTAALTRVIEDA